MSRRPPSTLLYGAAALSGGWEKHPRHDSPQCGKSHMGACYRAPGETQRDVLAPTSDDRDLPLRARQSLNGTGDVAHAGEPSRCSRSATAPLACAHWCTCMSCRADSTWSIRSQARSPPRLRRCRAPPRLGSQGTRDWARSRLDPACRRDAQRVLGVRVRGLYATKDTFCSLYLSRGARLEWLSEQTGVAHGTLRKHYASTCGPRRTMRRNSRGWRVSVVPRARSACRKRAQL